MSRIYSIYGTNGILVDHTLAQGGRLDELVRHGPATAWLAEVERRFSKKFAAACKTRFTNWSDELRNDELFPDFRTVMQDVILERQVPLSAAALRDHAGFFLGPEALAKMSALLQKFGEPRAIRPADALTLTGHISVELMIEPLEPKLMVLAMYVGNTAFVCPPEKPDPEDEEPQEPDHIP